MAVNYFAREKEIVKKENGRVDIYSKVGDRLVPELWNAKENCNHRIIPQLSGGIKCSKCGGWCCL